MTSIQFDVGSQMWYASIMKPCHRCKEAKDLSEFNLNAAKSDGHASTCRECMKVYRKDHYEANKPRLIQEIVARKSALLDFIWQYKSTHPCVDCGETDPIVLDFDHLRDKEMNIASMAQYGHSKDHILREIAKCEVVCSNDHRRRTFRRGGWTRNDISL